MKTAKLGVFFDADRKSNPKLEVDWSLVTRWKEDSRYHPLSTKSEADVLAIIEAITDHPHGVLTWIKRFW